VDDKRPRIGFGSDGMADQPEWIMWENPAAVYNDKLQLKFFKSLGITGYPYTQARAAWGNDVNAKFIRAPGFVHINGVAFGTVHLCTGKLGAPQVISEACALQARIGAASKQSKRLILLGDFNMDQANKDTTERPGCFWTSVSPMAMIQHITRDQATCRQDFVETCAMCIPEHMPTSLAGKSCNDNIYYQK
jgi:hypothetical protein